MHIHTAATPRNKFLVAFFLLLIISSFNIAALAVPNHAQASVVAWQKSMTMYPVSPTDFGSNDFKQTVSHMKSLGFNYITLILPYIEQTSYSTDIIPSSVTPTDASVVSAIQYIHSQGMGVVLSLHVDPIDGQWRAHLNPSSRTLWFSNYSSLLTKYATLAEQNQVEKYCVGTELISMSSGQVNPDNTTKWHSMIAAVRNIYHGKVFYDANWGNGNSFENEAPQIGFWDALDYIGISAYYELGGDGSVASLKSSWDNWNKTNITPIQQQFNKPILFSEMGYRSVTNARLQPWNSGAQGAYDPQEQVNDYTALLEYWNNYSFLEGIALWYAASPANTGGSGNTDYFIQNKPVEQTFSTWFLNPQNPQPAPSAPSFISSTQVSPPTGTIGQNEIATVNLTNQGGAVPNVLIDEEVYNSSGVKVAQKTFAGQNFSSSQTQQYAIKWTPNSSGTYVVKVGVFSSDWSQLYTWIDRAGIVTIGTTPTPPPSPTPTPTSTPSTPPPSPQAQNTSIWWPSQGSGVTGVQPFKAILDNLPLSQYSMFWQVDGGQLNQMQDTPVDYPHKEALVDITNWNWKGSGPYTINFVSKDSSGTIISQKSTQITITK